MLRPGASAIARPYTRAMRFLRAVLSAVVATLPVLVILLIPALVRGDVADNSLADKLANLAMDRTGEVTDAEDFPLAAPTPETTSAGDRVACPRCGCVIEVRTPSGIRPHQLKPFVCQCGAKMSVLPKTK